MIYQVSSVAEFSREINKNVYCFGAGKIFDAFMEKFKWFKLENNVKAIVDNHTSTMRSLVKAVNGICIPIISLEQMLSEMKETDCILITTAAYEEIVTQTAEIRKLDFIKYYIYWVMDIEQYDYERLQIKVPDCLSTCKIKKFLKQSITAGLENIKFLHSAENGWKVGAIIVLDMKLLSGTKRIITCIKTGISARHMGGKSGLLYRIMPELIL